MKMTQEEYNEARSKALAAQVPEADLTPEVIALYANGKRIGDPTADVQAGQVVSDAEAKESLSMLQKEAAANNWGPLAAKLIGKVAGFMVVLMLCVSLVMLGGCSNEAAQRANDQILLSTIALDQQHTANAEALIEYYQTNEHARIDALYDAAMASVVKKLPDGSESINPKTADALMRERLDQYAKVERNVKAMREKLRTISLNAAQVAKLSEGMKAYFEKKADNIAALNQATDTALEFLDKFLAKRK